MLCFKLDSDSVKLILTELLLGEELLIIALLPFIFSISMTEGSQVFPTFKTIVFMTICISEVKSLLRDSNPPVEYQGSPPLQTSSISA